ncbi:hypothetical protein DVA67_008890 [Solirubrobacter sp. CPCC 204708]|uniref:Lipoprotein n=1 Tax=Solirubrobacter deserti TaxID=2282478 RepID=A0ABT4REU1_9ACTN|nr:hypothetical protein [Solirubrobacter deserti]MBE2316090.1 hypothetical protein [Solirubrobacter deserti]MDA0136840.1 hypothetical protein [Solirubrobacter deserti]
MLAVVVALAGCGRGDDERTVGAVTERFLAAVEAGDGELACAQLSRAAAESIAATRSCPEAVTDLEVDPAAVDRTRVYGISAQVQLRGGERYFLEWTRAGWRISAAGCSRAPDDEPFDCEAEA